jgi:uncharacterized protein (TIGR00266 family)
MNDVEAAGKWYVDKDGEPDGPYRLEEIRQGLLAGNYSADTLVFGPGMDKWDPIAWVPQISGMLDEDTRPPLPRATYHRSRLAHDIDFAIHGSEMQYIEIELDPQEAVVAEAGAMMYMSTAIHMDTVFGDGTTQGGLFDKLVGAGKRLLTGESLFMTVFSNQGAGKQHVAFAAPYPGKIIPMNLAELGGEIICQKDAFLCAARGVEISISFQKKLGVGLFGREGFIMQRLSGDGLAFMHAGGTLMSRELAADEFLRVDTGCLVAMEKSVDYDIQYVGNIKSAIFGGEGIFFATLTGPGTVWLQSLPFSRLAGRIYQAAPQKGGSSGEGSVLDNLGGIGNIFQR